MFKISTFRLDWFVEEIDTTVPNQKIFNHFLLNLPFFKKNLHTLAKTSNTQWTKQKRKSFLSTKKALHSCPYFYNFTSNSNVALLHAYLALLHAYQFKTINVPVCWELSTMMGLPLRASGDLMATSFWIPTFLCETFLAPDLSEFWITTTSWITTANNQLNNNNQFRPQIVIRGTSLKIV